MKRCKRICSVFYCLFLSASLSAQLAYEDCNTPVDPVIYLELQKDVLKIQHFNSSTRGRSGRSVPDTVPVFFTVFRNDDGTFTDPVVDEKLISEALNQLNEYFRPINVYFVQLGEVQYIDHDLAATFNAHHHLEGFSYISTALNVYTRSGTGSFAQLPTAPGNENTRPINDIGLNKTNMVSLNSRHYNTLSFVHEVGHSYGLLHTFEGARVYHNPADPTPGYQGAFRDHPYGKENNVFRRELVLRQEDSTKKFPTPNAATAGDFVEDTPAFCVSTSAYPNYYPDIRNEACNTYPFNRQECNGCVIVDCNYVGDYIDYNGDELTETEIGIRNIMSYTSCRSEFTSGQYQRMAYYHEQIRKPQYEAEGATFFDGTVFFEDSRLPISNIVLQWSYPGQSRHSNTTTDKKGRFQAMAYDSWMSVQAMKLGSALDPRFQSHPWIQPRLAEIIANSYASEDWTEGIGENDLELLRQHLAGEIKLNGYRQLAADVDQDGRLTTADIGLLQEILDGNLDRLPAAALPWGFVPAYIVEQYATSFHDDPFNMEIAGISYVDYAPYLEADWLMPPGRNGENGLHAFKLGDLDGSSAPAPACSSRRVNLASPSASNIEAGSEVEIAVVADVLQQWEGFQLGLSYDPSSLEIIEISSSHLPSFDEQQHVRKRPEDGQLTVAWALGALELSPGDILFTVSFRTRIDLSSLHHVFGLDDSYTSSFFGFEGCNEDAHLRSEVNSITPPGEAEPVEPVAKFGCYPNPTAGAFQVVFNSSQNGNAILKIVDSQWRPVLQQTIALKEGINRINVDGQSLQNGILIVFLKTSEGVFYRKVTKTG